MLEQKITIKRFAKLIGYSETHVHRLIKEGKITPRISAIGKKYFYFSDVDAFLNDKQSSLFNKGEK